jgi:hypothetical protein
MSDHPHMRRATDHQVIPWTQLGVVIAAIVMATTFLAWLTGGLHPQWSADISELRASNTSLSNELKSSVADLQATQKAAAAAAASDKAQLTERIDAAKELFNTRLNGMWRPSDYAERDSHLHELDSRGDAIRDRVLKLEYGYTDLDKRINALSGAPVRNPRN